jgi:hypothetical protein
VYGSKRARKAATAVAVLAALLALSIVSPAMGGPSLSSVARTAKSALKTAKSASKTARSAKKTASQAINSYAYLKTVQVRQEVAAAPGTFADFELHCPSGYVAVGHGAGNGALDPVGTYPFSNGYLASMSNLSGSATYSGILYVICTYGEYSSIARTAAVLTRSEAKAQLAKAEAQARQQATWSAGRSSGAEKTELSR